MSFNQFYLMKNNLNNIYPYIPEDIQTPIYQDSIGGYDTSNDHESEYHLDCDIEDDFDEEDDYDSFEDEDESFDLADDNIETEGIELENDSTIPSIDEIPKKKRGRKPKDRIYFGEEQEIAVKEYLAAKDNADERNRIYEEKLAPAFKKMVEAIIRGNDFYIPNEEFIDTYRDTLSHLLSKADKFKIDKGKRAYSYYSNICKNYLIGEKQKYQKRLIRNPSYDALEMDFANDINYSTSNDDKGKKIAREEVELLTKRIQQMIDSPDEYCLKDSEIKLGKALINLMENWDFVLSTDKSSKLNKSVVLLFLRDQTGLDTKGIRDNLKKFKKEFLIIKNFVITQ